MCFNRFGSAYFHKKFFIFNKSRTKNINLHLPLPDRQLKVRVCVNICFYTLVGKLYLPEELCSQEYRRMYRDFLTNNQTNYTKERVKYVHEITAAFKYAYKVLNNNSIIYMHKTYNVGITEIFKRIQNNRVETSLL